MTKTASYNIQGCCHVLGLQVIHAEAGGTLHQHQPGYQGTTLTTTPTADTPEPQTVFAYFHQPITGPTPGFQVVTTAKDLNNPENEVILAIEQSQGNRKILAVIYHPECKLPNLPEGVQATFANTLSDAKNSILLQNFLNPQGTPL